jgi:SNF2 family DNA or RNA helicase
VSSTAAVATCPLCRSSFTQSDILSHEALTTAAKDAAAAAAAVDQDASKADAEGLNACEIANTPPKVTALLHAIAEMHREGPELKCVVFSQFTGFLNIIEAKLREQSIAYGRLDGSMSSAARKQALLSWKGLNTEGAPSILLISTKAGGTGLNLTEANRAFLMDVWWNAAVDDQAMDRIHRLGQTRPVKVIRYIAERIIEGRILELQKRKAALGKGALHRLSAEEARVARAEDLKSLFDL